MFYILMWTQRFSSTPQTLINLLMATHVLYYTELDWPGCAQRSKRVFELQEKPLFHAKKTLISFIKHHHSCVPEGICGGQIRWWMHNGFILGGSMHSSVFTSTQEMQHISYYAFPFGGIYLLTHFSVANQKVFSLRKSIIILGKTKVL